MFYRREILISLCLNELDLTHAAQEMAVTEGLEEVMEAAEETPLGDLLRESENELTEHTLRNFENGERLRAIALHNMDALQDGCNDGVKDEKRFKLFGSQVLICASDCAEQYTTLHIDPRSEPENFPLP